MLGPLRYLRVDEDRNGCAHSCGAVAEFHRLPEHPGDCSDESSRGACRSSDGMETTSMTSTFIAASGREVKVENCVSNKKSAFAKAAARQPSPFFFAGSPSLSRHSRAKAGDPGLIRTADLRFRKPMLYPSELRGHVLDFTRSAQKMAYCSGSSRGPVIGRPTARDAHRTET
jgi:hypothetical protein